MAGFTIHLNTTGMGVAASIHYGDDKQSRPYVTKERDIDPDRWLPSKINYASGNVHPERARNVGHMLKDCATIADYLDVRLVDPEAPIDVTVAELAALFVDTSITHRAPPDWRNPDWSESVGIDNWKMGIPVHIREVWVGMPNSIRWYFTTKSQNWAERPNTEDE